MLAGAVLMYHDSKGIKHIICYFSCKLNQYQKYIILPLRKRLWHWCYVALQHFDVYLNITKCLILVYTDHYPLVFVNKMKNHGQRLLRWRLLLQEYDMDNISITQNVLADVLSREGIPWSERDV